MKKVCFGLFVTLLVVLPATAQMNVPLSIQETLYPGDLTGHTYSTAGGISRTNESWCTGVPIADSTGLTATSGLTLASASAGQFRVLERWPDGNIKWLEACGVTGSLTAGSIASDTLLNSGSGNFGTPSTMTSVSGGTITVNTTGGACGSGSAICFTMLGTNTTPGNFDGIDTMRIGSTTVVAAGTASGFVVMGPANPATDCGTSTPCTTAFSSKNDPASVCSVEEDGPVQAVVKCAWTYTDGASHAYMSGSARFYFTNGSSKVRVESVLHNAANGASNTFATAFKAMQAYEFRIGSNLGSSLNWNIGNYTGLSTPTTGTMTTGDSVLLYQGQSTVFGDNGWSNCNSPCVNYTLDAGYAIKKNGSAVASGSLAQAPVGYADLSNGSSAGIQIGGPLFAGTGPRSLEFQNGGTGMDAVRIGLFSGQNSFPVYLAWPQWKTDEFYLYFRTSAPASIPNEFLKEQHSLIARTSISQYNSAGVFLYTLETPSEEDAFYYNTVTAASPSVITASGCAGGANYATLGCIFDVGTQNTAQWPLFTYPGGYQFSEGGGRDQMDWRYSYLTNWITRGHTGRYMQVKYFEMMEGDTALPHSDFAGGWRGQPSSVLDSQGRPAAVSSHPAGTCNVAANGTSITLVSGAYFGPWWVNSGAGANVAVNGSNYAISSVTSATALTLASAVAGAPLTGVACSLFGAGGTVGDMSLRSWGFGQPDGEHTHIWGIEDYYAMSGDQTIYDAVTNSFNDWILNLSTAQAGGSSGATNGVGNTSANTLTITSGSLPSYVTAGQYSISIGSTPSNYVAYTITSISGNTVGISPSAPNLTSAQWQILSGAVNSRASGLAMTNASRYSLFLTSTGDTADAAIALQAAENIYTMQVQPPLCVSGYPSDCSFGAISPGPWSTAGISATRGLHYNHYQTGDPTACYPSNANVRIEAPFQEAIFQQGVWELRTVAGSGWSQYARSFDIISGGVMWNMTEAANYDGTSSWTNNGFRYYVALDQSNCAGDTAFYPIRSNQTIWMPFLFSNAYYGGTFNPQYATWQPLFQQALQRSMSSNPAGVGLSGYQMDVGGYQLGALIYAINHGSSNKLQTVPISTFTSNGNGSYTISWTVPNGAQSYQIKWGAQTIVDWIGFNPVTDTFIGNPATTMNWFAATNAPNIPIPAAAGAVQSLTVNTGVTGLTASDFMVKAYSGAVTAPTGTASALVVVGGNNQTGTVSASLSSAFTVEVTSASGSAVSGVTVTFAVMSGGGSLSTTSAVTNSQGLASAVLTLGPAAGPNTVSASSGALAGSPITFTATGTAASLVPASLVLVSGNNQTGTAGKPLASSFTVEVTSASGAAVSGAAVTFVVASGGGTLSATSVTTNSLGQASAMLTLGSTAGLNAVTVTSGSLTGSPMAFNATGVAASQASGGGVNWTMATPTADWPTSNGYMSMNWDPISRKTVIYGHRSFAGTVSVTSGSSTVTWASGDKFADFWQPGDRISIGANTYNVATQPTGPVTPPATNNKTQLTLASNYSGSTGSVSYTAAETAIYSNDVIFYDAGTKTWSSGPGTGAQQDLCIVDTPTMPGQRHPIGQMTVDIRRGFLWLTGGVNQSCTITVTTNGSTTVTAPTGGFVMGTNWNGVTVCIGQSAASCVNYTVGQVVSPTTVVMTTPVPSGQVFFRVFPPENKNPSMANSKYDTYYLTLNADPTADAWTQVPTALHVPDAIGESAMRYDPDDDVIVLFGYDQAADVADTWVYCSTIGNANGTLTALQTAAGCTRNDDWTQVTTSCVGSLCIRNHPPGSNFPGMVWDPATHKVLQYGGTQGYLGTPQNVVFAYNVATRTWTQKTTVNVPPPTFWNNSCCLQSAPPIAYDTAISKMFYHYLNNNTAADYLYDPVADAWTLIGNPSTGVGATATNGASGQMATYDAAYNTIVGWNEGGPSNVWLGTLSNVGSATTFSQCDLNQDGVVNSLDVQLATNQVLNIVACGNSDLMGNGTCSVIDVQRIVVASLGGACLTGQ